MGHYNGYVPAHLRLFQHILPTCLILVIAMSEPLEHIALARYRFTVAAAQPLLLPEYKGSALRGGFGAVFRRIGCMLRLLSSSVIFHLQRGKMRPVQRGLR